MVFVIPNSGHPKTLRIFDSPQKAKFPAEQRSLEHYLVTYFNIAYYSCVCPFQIRRKKNTNKNGDSSSHAYYLHRNKVQQVACFIIQGLDIIIILNELRRFSSKLTEGNENPFDFLVFLLEITHLTMHGSFSAHLWFKSEAYLELIGVLSKTKVRVNVWIIRIVCSMYFVAAAGVAIYYSEHYRNADTHCGLSKDGSRTLFKCSLSQGLKKNENFGQDLVGILIYLVDSWKLYVLRVLGFSGDGLVFVIALIAYHVGVEFNGKLTKANHNWFNSEKAVRVVDEYGKMKRIFKLANDAAQLVLLTYTVDGMLYYSIYLKDAFLGFNVGSMITWYFFWSFTFMVYFAAEASRKMEGMKLWLAEPKAEEFLSESQLARLRYEVQVNSVGLSAYGVFIINYDFIGSIVGILMTYFIITVQFDNKK